MPIGTPFSSTSRLRFEEKGDRKSTRLNSSHLGISYAVFCLKKKNTRLKSKYLGIMYEDFCLYNKKKNVQHQIQPVILMRDPLNLLKYDRLYTNPARLDTRI